MARISDEKIQEIRRKVDIADVISKYIPVTRKGKNYVCTCPFHDDHDPSLSIASDKQIYKCFVCGAGGNVFSFVSRYENISFVESVLKVADYAGVDMTEYEKQSFTEKVDLKFEKLYKAHAAAIDFCNYSLSSVSAAPIRDYLASRQITAELIEKFQIGYNPKDDALYRFLHAKKFEDETLISGSLIRLTNTGIHDIFSNRIMIPIHDRLGRPIAFTARRALDSDEAKYINSTETDVYVKGNIIFNYHRVKEVVKKTRRALLVEGAMDVIAFEKVHIEEACATLGTACTKNQLQLLKNLHCRIDVCYDGDEAGINAIYKFGKMAAKEGLDFSVVDNQSGLDPDEIIEKYGKEELIRISNTTISWIDFLFKYLPKIYRLENYAERVAFAKEMKEEIDLVKEDFIRKEYFKQLEEISHFSMETLTERKPAQTVRMIEMNTRFTSISKAEAEILSMMLLSLQACSQYKNELGFLNDAVANKLALYIIDSYRRTTEIEAADLYSHIKEDNVKTLLIDLSQWELAPKSYTNEMMTQAIQRVRQDCVRMKINELKELSKQVVSPDDKARILQEIIELKRSFN